MHSIKICNDKNYQITIPVNTTIEIPDVHEHMSFI